MTDKRISAPQKAGTDDPSGDHLPFTQDVLRRIEGLGVDLPALIERYEKVAARKTIARPSGYLLRMAEEEAAERLGVSRQVVRMLGSTDVRQRIAGIQASLAAPRPAAQPSPELRRKMGFGEKGAAGRKAP